MEADASGIVAVAGLQDVEDFDWVCPALGPDRICGDKWQPAYVCVRPAVYASASVTFDASSFQ
eukprot:6257688-Pyramimonas_sp.AAC.1